MDTNYASLAYGVYVGSDAEEADRIDNVLPAIKDQCPDVRTVFGGSNQGETIFLVAYSKGVESGEYHDTADVSLEQQAGWTAQLDHAVRVLGYTGLRRPSWLCFTELA